MFLLLLVLMLLFMFVLMLCSCFSGVDVDVNSGSSGRHWHEHIAQVEAQLLTQARSGHRHSLAPAQALGHAKGSSTRVGRHRHSCCSVILDSSGYLWIALKIKVHSWILLLMLLSYFTCTMYYSMQRKILRRSSKETLEIVLM